MAKALRFVCTLLLSISALFNIAGGVGTTCVALNPTGYDGMFDTIARVQWLYILFVIVTTAFGVMMVRAVILLIKGRPNGYRYTLISLTGALAVGIVHIISSRILRGNSMPVDGVVYATLLTFLIFLIIRIPGIWIVIEFTKTNKNENNLAGGATAIVVGILSLTIQHLVASTHTINGINYADAFHFTTTGIGYLLLIIGSISILRTPKNLKSTWILKPIE